ncbi:hypothetical protein B0H15DRAFT_949833 [Mycena belliarum]|uniref:Ribonuclease H1 N-terminal domain-containing protein n=1 Tax=Mycena belliarum TaxID=1033014 RepID=A0AAD6U3M9_9AGAR|nr:hypothetical protein B0H15DRAFT_949833 [Mycena belliae]
MVSGSHPLYRTNLEEEQMVRDVGGAHDPRYYCLPPLHFDPAHPAKRPRKGAAFHLVSQGRIVGLFDSWLAAQASVSGFEGSAHQGFDSIEEATEAWQDLCHLGVHPHETNPKVRHEAVPPRGGEADEGAAPSSVSVPGARSSRPAAKPSPSKPSPSKSLPSALSAPVQRQSRPVSVAEDEGATMNFAIRGSGIVSSDPEESRARYQELQQRGEAPEILLTRSFAQAVFFAMDEAAEAGGAE